MSDDIILSIEPVDPNPTDGNAAIAAWLRQLANKVSYNDMPNVGDAYAHAAYAIARAAVQYERALRLAYEDVTEVEVGSSLRERLAEHDLSNAQFFGIAEDAHAAGISFGEFMEWCAEFDLNPYPAEEIWS